MKKICDEIFGEENFVSCIANVNNPKGRSDDKYIATSHEYLLIYKKQDVSFEGWKPEEKVTKRFNKEDEDGESYREIDLRKTGDGDRKEDRPNMHYYFYFDEKKNIIIPSKEKRNDLKGYHEIIPIRADGSLGRWRWEYNTALKNIDSLIGRFMPNRNIWGIFEKDFLKEKTSVKPTSSWTDKVFNSERGTEQFIELGFKKEVFPKPKPIGLIKKILEFVITKDDSNAIVLDFFAGSSSLAHGVIEFNAENETNVKFVCIQLPEITEPEDDAFKEGFKTIAEISKERIRRVISKMKNDSKESTDMFKPDISNLDLGFKVFKLSKSNFNVWDSSLQKEPEAIQTALEIHTEHINPEATQEAILFELLLKSGFSLATPIEQLTIDGKKVFSIAEGELLICLEDELTHDLLKGIAELKPSRVICLDKSFKGDNADALKTNAVQIMKSKGVVNFRTV